MTINDWLSEKRQLTESAQTPDSETEMKELRERLDQECRPATGRRKSVISPDEPSFKVNRGEIQARAPISRKLMGRWNTLLARVHVMAAELAALEVEFALLEMDRNDSRKTPGGCR